MIKISKKIWAVKGVGREDDLAYMAPYDETKDGEPLANVVKMMETGRSWAKTNPQNVYVLKPDAKHGHDYLRDEKGNVTVDHIKPAQYGEEAVYDNLPIEGVYVGSSVSRWSTSNKLFRVKDPRGFTVEIPTDNLATLLHHTTVIKGVVQQACVWGREGNSHILLPVNSEPYLETLGKMDTLKSGLIPVKDLKAGDWVKFFEDDTEYQYVGKVKITWKVRGYTRDYGWGRNHTNYGEWIEVEDDKWVDLFIRKYGYSGNWYASTPNKPKIVEVLRNSPIEARIEGISMWAPQRVTNKVNTDQWHHTETEKVSMKVK